MFGGTVTAGASLSVAVCIGFPVTCGHRFPDTVPHLMVREVMVLSVCP